MPNPVVHWEIIGPDATALQGFYRDLFDWRVEAHNPWQYGLVETGGEQGINGGIGPDQQNGRRVTVYVEVDDLQGYLDKAERLGGRVLMPPADVAGVTIAMFADPAGNVTGLIKGGAGATG